MSRSNTGEQWAHAVKMTGWGKGVGRRAGWIRRVGRRNPQTRPFWPSKRVLPGNGMPDALAPLKQSCPEMGGGRWPATPTSPGTDQLEPSPLRARGYAWGLGITPKSESTNVPIKLGLDLISLRRLCLAQVVHRQDGPLIRPLPCRSIGASRGSRGGARGCLWTDTAHASGRLV